MSKKQQQPPLSVEEQIANLKSINLIVNDIDYAKAILTDISYFRLIKAYSLELKDEGGMYKENVTFEHIVDLYQFNSSFRRLMFQQIERIEVSFRAHIANYFCQKYGVLGYKDQKNFDNAIFHKSFMDYIFKEINRNKKSPFIKNFLDNYVDGNIPLYALVEISTFGQLSRFYKNMLTEDKKAIAFSFGIPYVYLQSWIENIAYVRNVCAHYGRLYNAILTKTPRLFKNDRSDGVKNNRIFGTMFCIKYLLPNDGLWKNFVDTIGDLFEKYAKVNKETMGFPENWKELLLR